MSADLCRADMSAELLSYVVVLIEIFCQPVLPNFRCCNCTSKCASSSALVLPTLVVLMGQQLQNSHTRQTALDAETLL